MGGIAAGHQKRMIGPDVARAEKRKICSTKVPPGDPEQKRLKVEAGENGGRKPPEASACCKGKDAERGPGR